MTRSSRFVRIVRDPKFLMLILLVALNVVFSLASPSYMSVENIFNMLKQSAMVIMVASAATILMMTGNFDLSTYRMTISTSLKTALLTMSGRTTATIATGSAPLPHPGESSLMFSTADQGQVFWGDGVSEIT